MLIFTMPDLLYTNNLFLQIRDFFNLVMEYFRCYIAQSLPVLSFLSIYVQREMNYSNLNLYLAQMGTRVLGFYNCYVYI